MFRHAALALGLAAVVAGCGGGSSSSADAAEAQAGASTDASAAAADRLQTLSVPGFPNAEPVDIYRTAGATRAIVVLHGGGGNKSAIAYQLGLNDSATSTNQGSINWAWLDANRVTLVVPQGEHIRTEPNASTWSNHAMISGRIDKAYLQALAAQVRETYGLSNLTLIGHSMGGVMANRMWCESPTTFESYASFAGPASAIFLSADTPCAPGSARPYLGIIGDADSVMQTTGAWSAATWTVNPSVVNASRSAWENDQVIAEFPQQQARTRSMCNAALSADSAVRSGQVDTWTSCNGRLVLKEVHGADHGIASISAQMGGTGPVVMDAVMAFLRGL